jgi:hypothetical protein
MAPRKKYRSKLDLHVNIEQKLKEFGDIFGIIPATALEQGYIYIINHDIARYNPPIELREKWTEFIQQRDKDISDAIQREKELLSQGEKVGTQTRIINSEKDKFIQWVYESLFSQFSSSEIQHYAQVVRSNDDFKVRFTLSSIKNQYMQRTGEMITPWTKEDETVIINHLIELGGV